MPAKKSVKKTATEFPKNFDFAGREQTIYKRWEQGGFFKPQKKADAKRFSIVLPPPNATGILHAGHATMLAVEDIMIRYHRLKGDETLWIPGTDHAAIATQNVVEKKVFKEEGKSRHDLGRAELMKRIERFVENSKITIRSQVRRMGASVDWAHERYTLDNDISRAIRMVFTLMYNDGLIYRGNRIVNWCTRCRTTLADDEVEYREETAPFYHFKFGPFSIGTVRPETKLGDKYVVVHPSDKRYKKYHGQKTNIPWIDGQIEMMVLADTAADPTMGSGAMTITPQHSFVDFEIAERHKLPIHENLIGLDGNLTAAAGKFAGLPVREAREKFVEILKRKGLVEKIDEKYTHNVSVCYRCSTPVEPLVSKQWFVAVNKKSKRLKGKTLREVSLQAVKTNETVIIPERFSKTYVHWMNNLHDWCISRQIWFGHRIPVWYRNEETYVGVEAPQGKGWIQDEDTLDTWFSSGTWTFSTLLKPNAKTNNLDAWIKQSKELKRFHPTNVLETGYDILFFWIARMMLMTEYAMKEVPFKTVYLHGLVRDEHGRKMSKSIGNTIDPVGMIEKYGADAMRLSLVIGTTPGNDTRLSENKIASYRNFVTKLWNIARYILATTQQTTNNGQPKTLADEWILTEFENLKRQVTEHIEEYRFSLAGETLYEFTWNKLADWYLEISKIEEKKDAILRQVLRDLLVLWHPFAPFVTEEIWTLMNGAKTKPLIVATWPRVSKKKIAKKVTAEFTELQTIVSAIRDAKHEAGVMGTIPIEISGTRKSFIIKQQTIIEALAKVTITANKHLTTDASRMITRTLPGLTIALAKPATQTKDTSAEKAELEKYIANLTGRLSNQEFRSRAPAAIISKEEDRLKDARERLASL